MEKDIVPERLEVIQNQFDKKIKGSPKIKKVLMLLKNKQATYVDVNNFAIEIGEILSQVLNVNVTQPTTPPVNNSGWIAENGTFTLNTSINLLKNPI